MDAGEGLLQKRTDEVFVFGPRDFHFEMMLALEVLLAYGDEWLIREPALGPFEHDLETAQHRAVARYIHAMLLLELAHGPFDEQLIEVIAAQMSVTVTGLDFDDALFDDHNGDVERAAAKVVDEHRFICRAPGAVSERGGGRFIDNAHDFEAGEFARDLRRLALTLVEEGRDGDNGLFDRLPKLSLAFEFEFPQNKRGNFLGRKLLVAEFHPRVLTHLAFDGKDGRFGCGDELVLGNVANNKLSRRVHAHARRHGGLAMNVNDFDLAVQRDGEDGVRGAKVNANNEVAHFS